MNDQDREQWVMNDESLYNWWLSTRMGITVFVRKYRAELTAAINRALNVEPKA